MITSCSNCCVDVEDDEVGMCDECEEDGLCPECLPHDQHGITEGWEGGAVPLDKDRGQP